MNSNNRKFDDLTQIKFIGPKMQSWLRQKLKVRTYQDLAGLSLEKIQTQLNADNKPVAKSNIEAWINQAKELSHEKEKDPILSSAESSGTRANTRSSLPKEAGNWKEYASFMVYFEAREVDGRLEKRIKVSHLEEDKSKVWSDLTAENFLWMLNQAGEGPFLDTTPSDKEVEPELEKAKVEVTQIQIFQPEMAEKPLATSNGKPLQRKLIAGEPFALEVLFSLTGEAAESIVEQHAPYSVQVIANEIETKVGTNLGRSESETLVDGVFDYRVRIPETTLDPGVHRLWAMVSVKAANTVPNFLEGPAVKVV